MTVTWSWNRNEPNAARRLWQHHWSQRRARNSLARMMTRFDIAPEDLAQIAMREVASGLGILSLFGPAFGRAFSAPFDRNIAAAAVPWYLAGGAPTPIAVYQPKGAASLAASYVNLVNPGTYDAAPGVAPTLDASGWVFNGTTQYLTSNIAVAANTWSVLMRFSDLTGTSTSIPFGVVQTLSGVDMYFLIAVVPSSDVVNYHNRPTSSGFLSVGPSLASGVLALAGLTAYRNGIAEPGAMVGFTNAPFTLKMYLGARNNAGVAANFMTGKVQAAAVWNTSTNHATWMPAVSAACALI